MDDHVTYWLGVELCAKHIYLWVSLCNMDSCLFLSVDSCNYFPLVLTGLRCTIHINSCIGIHRFKYLHNLWNTGCIILHIYSWNFPFKHIWNSGHHAILVNLGYFVYNGLLNLFSICIWSIINYELYRIDAWLKHRNYRILAVDTFYNILWNQLGVLGYIYICRASFGWSDRLN